MSKRKSYLTLAVVVIASLTAGIIGAQTLEEAASKILKKDGAFAAQKAALRQSVERHNEATKKHIEELNRGGGHHGGHPGGRPGGGWNPGHGGHPGRHPGGGWRPGHGGHPHHNWGRWRNHPGWGRHYYGRWGWDRRGWPIWWGWIVWRGAWRADCVNAYRAQYANCNSNCQYENNVCVSNCYGDGACIDQCNLNNSYCANNCGAEYSSRVRLYCPL